MGDDTDIKNEVESGIVRVKWEVGDDVDFDEPPNSSGDTIDNNDTVENTLDINNDSFDSVHFLLNNSIESLTYEQKLYVKAKLARPKLSITQKDGKATRSFLETWYKKYRWLAGCKTKQTYHCYHCLMFGGEEGWTKIGQTTVKNFELKASKHAISKIHIKNSELFHMLGRQKIDYSCSESSRIEVQKHNSSVIRNQKIVSRLIDVVCYLGRQELSFSGNEDDCDKRNYIELLNMLAMEEGLIKDHLETRTVFHDTSSIVQDNLIESVSVAMNEIIHSEINEINFVSIQVDRHAEVCVKAPLSIIVRYVHGENIVERFMGFYYVSNNRSAKALSKVITGVIEKYNMEKKVICQSYDGDSLCGAQAIIRQKYSDASLVHSSGHNLNLVLVQSLKNIKEVKIFIRNLIAFDSFFRSFRRIELLREQGFQLPDAKQISWNYNFLAVRTVKQHYKELQRAVNHVIESDDWNPESVNSALGLQQILNSSMFTFLLCLFNKILICSEHLFQIFQVMGSVDINLCMKEFRETKTNIVSLRSEYVIKKCVKESLELNANIQDASELQDFVETHQQVIYEIFDSILEQLEERFCSFEDFLFVELLNHKKFEKYKKSFPDCLFNKLITYPGFNFAALRNELINIYSSADKAIPCAELLSFITDNELQPIYRQTMNLIRLILTIPFSPIKTGSTLQRIKTYLHSSMYNNNNNNNNLPSNIATITIEKDLSESCCKNPAFKERVIYIFSEMKNKRVELIYKKT